MIQTRIYFRQSFPKKIYKNNKFKHQLNKYMLEDKLIQYNKLQPHHVQLLQQLPPIQAKKSNILVHILQNINTKQCMIGWKK